MSKRYKVKTAAVFNGQPVGSTIELDESLAKHYEALKYVEIIEEVKPQAKKATSVPKKPAGRTSTRTTRTKATTEKATEDKAEK